jgi:4-aminobutyrate aminotransferase-like enzyme
MADREVTFANGERIRYSEFARLPDLQENVIARMKSMRDQPVELTPVSRPGVPSKSQSSAASPQNSYAEVLERHRQDQLRKGDTAGAKVIEGVMRERGIRVPPNSTTAKIYRWVDSDGVVHYGDERNAPAESRQQ